MFMSAVQLVGALLTLFGLLLLGYSLRPTLSSALRHSPLERLAIEPFTDALFRSYPSNYHESVIGQGGRVFALLSVRNVGTKNCSSLVARCLPSDSEKSISCFWSKESGEQFTPGGSHSADLGVGDTRVLVIAQAFTEDRLWARLPGRQEVLFEPPARTQRMDGVDVLHLFSRDGELLDFGPKIRLTVSFHAEGVEQAVSVRLDFKKRETSGGGGHRRSAWKPSIVIASLPEDTLDRSRAAAGAD